jgi:O-antigen/teichoic acid export membrane protein
MEPQPPGTGLRQKTTHGVAWTTVDAVGSRLITTIVFVLLARLLEPADFGLLALSLVFVAFARLLVDQGFSAAIVQRAELTKGHLDTAFWTSIVAGLFMAALLCLLSRPLASVLEVPRLAPVLQALSAVVVLGAPSSTAVAVLRRSFGFRNLAFRRLLGASAGGVAGVGAALYGMQVWSLVIQALVQAITSTITLWTVTPYRPGICVSRDHLSDLFTYSNKVIGIGIVNFASRRSDDLLIGAVLGPTALGLYSVAYRLLTILTEILTETVERVAFPAFSQLQTNLPRLRRAYHMSLRTSVAITAPVYLATAVLAPQAIVTFFGTRWEPAVPVMQVLALGGFAQAVVAPNNTLLLSVGRARTALYLSTATAVVNILGFLVAVQFGILAVAVAFSLRAYLLAPLSVWPVNRILGISWRQWIRPLMPPVFSALVASGMVLAIRRWALDGLPPPAGLALAGLAMAVIYLALLRLSSPWQFQEILDHLAMALPPLRRMLRASGRTAESGTSLTCRKEGPALKDSEQATRGRKTRK